MDRPVRFLLIEDRVSDAGLLGRELRKAYPDCATHRVDTRTDLLRALRDFAPDVVLSDHSLPQFNARDALALIRQERPATPVVIVTGSLDEETAAEYIKGGAADYVVKDRLHRLVPAVQRALALRRALEDQERAEAARARSEQRFRRLVEHSSDVITLLDARGDILYSTQALKPTLGYTQGEKLGRSVFELIHPEDRDAATRLFHEALNRPGAVARADLRLRHANGAWRQLEVAGVNHLDDPVIGAIVVTYHDVTERRAAEEALRDVAEHLRALIDASPLAIHSLRADGTVRIWNAAAERLFGWRADEVLGKALPIVPKDRLEEHQELRRRVLAGEQVAGIEVIRERRDGTSLRISLSAAPLFDEAGAVTGVMAVLSDVTELRQLEDQYRQAQKMEAVGRLAGGVAHDFNNVLTAIRLYCDLLIEDMPDEDPRRADIDEISKAAERATGLTRQLLAFSRQQVLVPKVVDIRILVTDMANMLRRLLGEDIELCTSRDCDPATVMADAGQLEQVVMNLAVNARDAMPTGGRLSIEVAVVELGAGAVGMPGAFEPGKYVVLSVSDTGTGMDEDTKAHLFEPFFTTKEKGKGTGLGLATVFGIVKQFGGCIYVYSELEHGTTFKVYLPHVTAKGARQVAAPPEPVTLQGTETVLLTEDDASVRTAVREALERRGYMILEASDPSAALDIAARHDAPIHLLLTDVVMPTSSGTELAERLRAVRPRTHVLFMSGYTDDDVARRGVVQAGVSFLQKPFGPEGLARKVREALDGPLPS